MSNKIVDLSGQKRSEIYYQSWKAGVRDRQTFDYNADPGDTWVLFKTAYSLLNLNEDTVINAQYYYNQGWTGCKYSRGHFDLFSEDPFLKEIPL